MSYVKKLVSLEMPDNSVVTETYWSNLITALQESVNHSQEYLQELSNIFDNNIGATVQSIIDDVNSQINITGDSVTVNYQSSAMSLNTAFANIPAVVTSHAGLQGIKAIESIGNAADARHSTYDIWYNGASKSLETFLNEYQTSTAATMDSHPSKSAIREIGFGTSLTPSGNRAIDGQAYKIGDLWVTYE